METNTIKRTQEEINAEIALLEAVKPKVCKQNFFGDNLHAAIDAQINVLKLRQTDNEWLWNEYSAEESYGEDDEGEEMKGDELTHAGQSAREAMEWLTDSSQSSLAAEWATLAS